MSMTLYALGMTLAAAAFAAGWRAGYRRALRRTRQAQDNDEDDHGLRFGQLIERRAYGHPDAGTEVSRELYRELVSGTNHDVNAFLGLCQRLGIEVAHSA